MEEPRLLRPCRPFSSSVYEVERWRWLERKDTAQTAKVALSQMNVAHLIRCGSPLTAPPYRPQVRPRASRAIFAIKTNYRNCPEDQSTSHRDVDLMESFRLKSERPETSQARGEARRSQWRRATRTGPVG